MNYQQDFESALFELFPDVKVKGCVDRQKIMQVMDHLGTKEWPKWIIQNKISRGLYAVGDSVAVAAPIKQAPVMTKVVQIESTKAHLDRASLIPQRDKNYVVFGNHKDVEAIARDGVFFPVFITGPTGNGKSMMIEQIHAQLKKPLIRINFNAQTDEEQLIGSKTLVDGNVEIVEGPVLVAMRNGISILCDEIDAGGANALMCLQAILEGKPYYFKLKNEIVYPQPGFNIYATANTKGKGSDDGQYIGTNVLNEAFLERFGPTIEQEYPSASSERKIVMNLMNEYGCVDEKFADDLVKWADAIRRTYESGGVDSLVTTRRVVHILKAFKIFKDAKKSIEMCCNRFDDVTKAAFIDLFDKITDDAQVEVQPDSADGMVVLVDEIGYQP